MRATFTCTRCGKNHKGPSMSYGAAAPYYYERLPARERDARCELTEDLCVIDGEHIFIRGCLEIPVLDAPGPFVWGVWASLSRQNFARVLEMWDNPGREAEPPYFGWLATQLPGYPPTLNLKRNVHTRAAGERPLVELEPTDHPLAVEQQRSITMARVREIAEMVLHQT